MTPIALMAVAASLADPIVPSPLGEGISWLEGAVLGTLATSIAIIAVAVLGVMMLAGRLNLKRGATVVLGCFILFGAPSIAAGIIGAASQRPETSSFPQAREHDGSAPKVPAPIPTPAYDPYAGASLPPR